MAAFFFKRLLSLLAVLFCVVTITFFMIRLAPGGPFDRERKVPPNIEKELLLKYRLDGPQGRADGRALGARLGLSAGAAASLGEAGSLLQQYGEYLWDIVRHGDLRISTKYLNRSVNEILAQTLPVSLSLGALAFLLASTAGVWLGTFAAVRHNTWLDAGAMFWALLAISVPAFVTGPLCILVFALDLGVLPVGGWNSAASIVLPSLVLAAPYVAYIARLMRSSMLETLEQDFVRTARAKGLPESAVVYKHALKVAILPVVSFLGPLAANLLTGSLIVESVFNIPGMGGFFVNAIQNRDGFLLGGVVIVYCVLLVVMNLAVDIAYTLLDRRVRLE
jgi:oligopeptide transport system permease protein